MLITANAGADIIILKDGRSITGDILQKDRDKVIIKEAGITLTYYKDEIKFIRETNREEKEKLVAEFMEYYPLGNTFSMWVKRKSVDKQKFILSAEEENIQKLLKIRKQIFMNDFSASTLRAAINFFSSVEGKQYVKDMELVRRDHVNLFYPAMEQIAEEAIKKDEKQNQNH
jgi:hypothetical protein